RVVFGGTGQVVSLDPTRPFPYTTDGLSTVFSGDGWGIFVVDFQNNLYIHKHIEGDFHHSSFLSGDAVTAAGEITVNEQGWISVITAKSGHYMPTVADMQRMVHCFPQIPGNCVIRPDFTDTQGGRPARVYAVDEFRTDGTSAPTLNRQTVLNRVPNFAKTMEAYRWINRVPI
ncbi:MAG TPA: hypothetical protein VL523_20275, partial [Terriglobia bacterium]|nr:hypothetical protein [Terriglobia bacterium]